jgi:thiol-disulfide isomerase/thioredoxin
LVLVSPPFSVVSPPPGPSSRVLSSRCPPCRGFTPKLAEIYKAYQAKGLAFEILFVSSDRDESAFGEYFGEQPRLARRLLVSG